MKKVKAFLEKLKQYKGLKYILVIVFAIIVVGFVGDNCIWSHLKNVDKINELKSEIATYQERYDRDQAKLLELNNNPKAVEKIARERYFMKKENEEIFVLSDDNTTEE